MWVGCAGTALEVKSGSMSTTVLEKKRGFRVSSDSLLGTGLRWVEGLRLIIRLITHEWLGCAGAALDVKSGSMSSTVLEKNEGLELVLTAYQEQG